MASNKDRTRKSGIKRKLPSRETSPDFKLVETIGEWELWYVISTEMYFVENAKKNQHIAIFDVEKWRKEIS